MTILNSAALAFGLAFAPAAFAEEPAAEPEAEEPAGAETATYKFDTSNSWLYVIVKYDRNATIPGHDHVLRAMSFDGSVTWNTDDLAACDVKIEFPVTALEVDPSGARSRAGFEGTTSDGDKKKIKANALGKYQIQSDKFPKISFQSTQCTESGSKVNVDGKLSIHGVGANVTAPMEVTVDGNTLKAKGSFTKTHSDFGMDPFTALLGALRNDKALTFVGDLTATKQ